MSISKLFMACSLAFAALTLAAGAQAQTEAPAKKTVKKAAAKPKAKAKAAPKTRGGKTKKFAGKGRKLGDSTPGSGSEVEDESMAEEDLDALDDETREMTIQKMKEGKAAKRAEEKEKMKPIRKAEAALKKEVGRKLTNGEKNSIRLVLVSSLPAGRSRTLELI